MPIARGTFEVQLQPQQEPDAADGTALGRMSIDKRIHGDLEATTRGQMLSAVTATQGSAGYVAIERVSGALQGRSGTFVLQHSGSMERGAQTLSISVVPDSGTGELVGLAGVFRLRIEGGQHFYELEYSLSGVA
ncbi:MAG: DUF3224 domain-containing protein [Burkholderiaceae bacterium]|nr:MAG: DUF3224 domain-containing protein [Burkholderiaceae bacterium]